jgi:hypothetical protein
MRKGAAGSNGLDPKFRRVELPAPLRIKLSKNALGFPSGGVFIFTVVVDIIAHNLSTGKCKSKICVIFTFLWEFVHAIFTIS